MHGPNDPFIKQTDNNSTTTPTDTRNHEPWPDFGGKLKSHIRKTFTRKLIYKRFPILKWAQNYRIGFIYKDFVAGITVGLTAIPQGIAYAVVAGLEPQYGLYAELLASFVYCIFGSCRNVTIGPTAIMALMVQPYALLNPAFAVLIAFLVGIIILLFGLLNFGFLVQFISIPVTIGFISAAAVQIGSVQIKSLFGIPGRSSEFLEAWIHVIENIGQIRLWDSLLGIGTILFLLTFKKIGEIKHPKLASPCKYISLARNALSVIIGSTIAYSLSCHGEEPPFALTGKITSSFPPFQLPAFFAMVGDVEYSFMDMVNTYGTSLITIPFVAILEIIVVAKAFSKGKSIDASQELIALGSCNLLGSLVSSMPVTGSFTRTAVNEASGVKTPFGGIATGAIILLSIGFLTNSFQYIPKATLAAVILTAMYYMIEFRTIWKIWKTRRIDILPFIVTFIACLFIGLDYGILVGISVNLIFILYSTSRPQIDVKHIEWQKQNLLIITPEQSLVFSAADHLKTKILKYTVMPPVVSEGDEDDDNKFQHVSTTVTAAAAANGNNNYQDFSPENNYVSIVIIDGRMVQTIDITVAKIFQSLIDDFRLMNKQIIFWNWKEQPTGIVWRLDKKLGELFIESDSIDSLLDKVNIHLVIN